MTNRHTADALIALHDLHLQARPPTLMQLVRRTGIGAGDLSRAIDQLAAQDLVDPVRLRLTLLGFAAGHALTKKPAASRAA
jgi:hypothetical protein